MRCRPVFCDGHALILCGGFEFDDCFSTEHNNLLRNWNTLGLGGDAIQPVAKDAALAFI
jgi:hypothetical protein